MITMTTKEYREKQALIYAEQIGIYEYEVNGDWMEWFSFYHGEGWYFVRRNLLDGDERRELAIEWSELLPVPKFLKTESGATKYNYNVG